MVLEPLADQRRLGTGFVHDDERSHQASVQRPPCADRLVPNDRFRATTVLAVDHGLDRRTDLQRRLVGVAAELGATFATRADRYDRQASFPYENFADLRDAGFLGLCIPVRFGGLGADLPTYAMVAEELGATADRRP